MIHRSKGICRGGRLLLFACVALATSAAVAGHAYQRQQTKTQPDLPGIVHSAPCKELAPGVYDCGDHKNHNRQEVPKTGRWKVTVRPTDDITITARSKAEREAAEQQ